MVSSLPDNLHVSDSSLPGKDFDFAPAPLKEPVRSSLESIWDDKSPFSVLQTRPNGSARSSSYQRQSESPRISHGSTQFGVHNLQEIEDEMRQHSRGISGPSQQHERLLQQQQLQEELLLQQQQQELFLQQQQESKRQRLSYQQEQLQRQRLQHQHFLHQRDVQTPPPRMLQAVSQSPRFLEHQRHILLLQQQQEQQQIQHLQELQEQLRIEELERQLRAQQISHLNQGPVHLTHDRYGISYADAPLRQEEPFRHQSRSPRNLPQDASSYIASKNIQMQQRLLAEIAQGDFMRDTQGIEQESLRMEAMRKIVETEMMEERRRRKAAKIAHMVISYSTFSFFF